MRHIDEPISTVDTHTAGGPARVVLSGLPRLTGETAAERMLDFQTNHDGLRKFLLNEPRGHRGMYGAVIGPSSDPNADLSVFFMTTGGYLPTCVHGSIGVATALLEEGTLSPRADGNLYFETPGGVLRLTPRYRNDQLGEIALEMPPGFVIDPKMEIAVDGRTITAAAVFSGVPFVLVDAGQLGTPPNRANLGFFVELGKALLQSANAAPGNSFALALFYEALPEGGFQDVVIGRTGGIDRSPCGAGVGALAVGEHAAGRLRVGDVLTVRGVIGTTFTGEILRIGPAGDRAGAVPQVTGSAWVTGRHQFALADSDPLTEGFDLGV